MPAVASELLRNRGPRSPRSMQVSRQFVGARAIVDPGTGRRDDMVSEAAGRAQPLAGKAALVTGGSRSIGAAIAKRLAADGAAVAITYGASAEKARAVVQSIEQAGGRALAIHADAGDEQAVRAAVQQTVAAFNSIDILVNNAGIALGGPIEEIAFTDYQ